MTDEIFNIRNRPNRNIMIYRDISPFFFQRKIQNAYPRHVCVVLLLNTSLLQILSSIVHVIQ